MRQEVAGYIAERLPHPLFEVWLLMHFEQINDVISKRKIFQHLENYLKRKYDKSDDGTIREITQNGSIENAIKNAYKLAVKFEQQDKFVYPNIKEMNPFTSVHELVEQFMVEIS